jgi:hypothetical protein
MGDTRITDPADNIAQAYPITTYLRYLIEYRDDTTQAELQALVNVLEEHGRFRTEGSQAPSVLGFEPRQGAGPTPAGFTTAQYAVFQLLCRGRFELAGGPQAEDLIRTILRHQEPDTGLIDHILRDLPGHDPADYSRMRTDAHPYVGLKELTLIELQRAFELLDDDEASNRHP